MFRRPYDKSYNPALYATDVGYILDDDFDVQNQNALEASLTQQSFASQVDINNIVKRAMQTGSLPEGTSFSLRFGDASTLPDFLEAQIIVASANEAFAQMPSELRDRFNNDPVKLLAFMSDEKNLDEAVKLGLTPATSPVADSHTEAVAKTTENTPAA